MKIICDESCTGYHNPGHPERPSRILDSLALLHRQKELSIDWLTPVAISDEAILRAHLPEHIARLRVPHPFDADTFHFPEVEQIARMAAGAGLLAVGFCYLSNIAIAALHALATGTKRIAVFDFDVHHGNGTEDILLNEPGAAFFSVHEHPCYPGTGAAHIGDNCFNFPVRPHATREEYRKALSCALDELKKFDPEIIGVSAGFDAYSQDPLACSPLHAEDFHWLGGELRKLGVPMFSLLEGGYSDDLPELILAYLKGVDGK
jgi:acetoin utilization deacetylase AcuC-like enzyme